MSQNKKMILKAEMRTPEGLQTFQVIGRPAQTLEALIESNTAGITALEMSSWAFRLGAYVHILRHDYGLNIETLREPHDGGWHARYVLHTPVNHIKPH